MHHEPSNGESIVTVLNAQHADIIRRAAFNSLAEQLEMALHHIREMVEQADMSRGVIAADARAACQDVRKELDAVDALGWPPSPDVVVRPGDRVS